MGGNCFGFFFFLALGPIPIVAKIRSALFASERARSDANNAERILATIGIGPKAKKKNKPKQLPPMEHDTARALGPPPEGELSHVRKNEVTEQLPYVSPYETEGGSQTVTF